MDATRRSRLAVSAGAVLVATMLLIAGTLPVAGQDPTPTPAPDATVKPGKGPKADPQLRAAKVPEVAVSLTGRVGTRTDADGDTEYTLTAGGTVYDLQVGPPWWWGETHPLDALVGDTVRITGERREGSTDVDVLTVDGKTLREAGRPPWAGGWKAVGERHPGWAQWKADKVAEKLQGRGGGRPPWAGPKTSDDAEGSPSPGG
jgi:hypothetical protein